ncbi:DUF488 domain-containing protein [Marinospirillum insulare]|uniref:DUF488 family protein n=1 Tax=Marinospirillum insulare TaxID=217169 RepID=A0ABQ6A0P6_9GAMM|nr:DUF488 family protein [Marinospirillum insulare]GLR64845.1 hypothetical protein GCM10007878_22830 [Marinospirillum insulare]
MVYDLIMKRIYQEIDPDDGFRLLADRLWPRGFKRDALHLDLWLPKICPSNQLRKSWHSGELKFAEFEQAYTQELDQLEDDLLPLMIAARKGRLTLLTSVKDIEVSHLPVLKNKLLQCLKREDWLSEGNEPSSSPCYMHEFNDW